MLAAGLPPRLKQRIVASRPAETVKLEPVGTGLRSTSNCGGLGGTVTFKKEKKKNERCTHQYKVKENSWLPGSGKAAIRNRKLRAP